MTILQAISSLSEHPGAMRMKEIDPHGFTLSLVAVMVVFSALLILFLLYSLSGGIFTGKFKRKPKAGSKADGETAAAIAMALDLYGNEDEVPAAIAAALHLYLSESVHDAEPGFITIRRDLPSTWNDKSHLFRKTISGNEKL